MTEENTANQYGDTQKPFRYVEVKAIIDEWDPLRLWSCMCPPDEYDSEIVRAIREASDYGDVDRMADLLLGLFYEEIDESRNHDAPLVCREKAEQILTLRKEGLTGMFCPFLKKEITDYYCARINMLIYGGAPLSATLWDDMADVENAETFCDICENVQLPKSGQEKHLMYQAGMQFLLEQATKMLGDEQTDESRQKLSDDQLSELNEMADKMKEAGFLHPNSGTVANPR